MQEHATIDEMDQQIEMLAQTVSGYAHLRSIPGIGPVYATGLLAKIQDVQRFMTDHQGQPRTHPLGTGAAGQVRGPVVAASRIQ